MGEMKGTGTGIAVTGLEIRTSFNDRMIPRHRTEPNLSETNSVAIKYYSHLGYVHKVETATTLTDVKKGCPGFFKHVRRGATEGPTRERREAYMGFVIVTYTYVASDRSKSPMCVAYGYDMDDQDTYFVGHYLDKRAAKAAIRAMLTDTAPVQEVQVS